MTDAELIARVKQAVADLHLAAKLSNKPPLSAAFILNDVADTLAAQAQEIERLKRWAANQCTHERQGMYEQRQRAEAAEARMSAIEAATIERCESAIRSCNSIDENGYICQKSVAITAIRSLKATP
jgi:hypothetical protein